MARIPSTHDPFSAIAEPRRRALIEALIGRELTVGEAVDLLGWSQPMVSKHLGVLKEVGLVSERKAGRHRVYRVNAAQLKPVKDWVIQFDRFWGDSLNNLGKYLNDIQAKEAKDE